MADHLQKVETGRGFDVMPSIEVTRGVFTGRVSVFESSASSDPRVWLSCEGRCAEGRGLSRAVDVSVHLSAEQAWQLAEQLMTLVRNHYQGDARPAERAADLLGEGAKPCGCDGGWTVDENWSPEHPGEWSGERSPGAGLVPCGLCNLGGWDAPWPPEGGAPRG